MSQREAALFIKTTINFSIKKLLATLRASLSSPDKNFHLILFSYPFHLHYRQSYCVLKHEFKPKYG